MKRVNETLYKIIKIYKKQSFYFIHNSILYTFQSLQSNPSIIYINIPTSKLCHKHNNMKIITYKSYYITLKISFKKEISAQREISRDLSTDAAVDHTKGEKRRAENE